MTEYEKLRENLARNMDADLWPMLDVALANKMSLSWREREAGESLKKAEAVMAVILAALQEPTIRMIGAGIAAAQIDANEWQAMLNASPLVKP